MASVAFLPLVLAAAIVAAGAMLIPLGPDVATTVTDVSSLPEAPGSLPAGEPPRGTFQVYGMGLVAAATLAGVALLTRGRFYP